MTFLDVHPLHSYLARDIPDEVARQVESFNNVLGSVRLPRDRQLDEAADVAATLARGAVHLALGSAFIAVLLAVAVFAVLAIETPLPIATAIMHPPVSVTIETA